MLTEEQTKRFRQLTIAAVIRRHLELTTVPECLCGFTHGFSKQVWADHVANEVDNALTDLDREIHAGYWTRNTYFAHLRFEMHHDAPMRHCTRIIQETCEKCGAESGYWCEYADGRRAGSFQSFHRVRIDASLVSWEEELRKVAELEDTSPLTTTHITEGS